MADRLRGAAALLAPGWSGAALDSLSAQTPPGEGLPPFVRVGTAAPLDDAWFPALVPLLGTGHLVLDADPRDPRAAGLLRAVLLRLLAATPAGSLLVRIVDGGGATFTAFGALTDAGLMLPPTVDLDGLRTVLTEAEQWVAPEANRLRRPDRTMLLVIAELPTSTGTPDLERIEALAVAGPAAGLHLVVAGWPPATGSDPRSTRVSLPTATTIEIRSPYALLGDPPDASFGRPGPTGRGLNSPVFVEDDPDPALIDEVCRRLAQQVETHSRLALPDLLPDPDGQLWTASAADGLSTTVGDANGRPVTLGFTELTPHWLVSGRPGAGRSAFLTNVLLGLTTRYGPDELALYLVDLADGESFAEYLQTERDRSWIPQVRAAGIAADREYVFGLLCHLEAELHRRVRAAQRVGARRFAELRSHQLAAQQSEESAPVDESRPGEPESTGYRKLPRIVCVIENYPLLFTERDRLSAEAARRLESLARDARPYGIHLILAGSGPLRISAGPAPRDPVLGQFPVRVALPGGGPALEPANDAAAGLPLGSAVINTAGGLGGPRGAIRGHERLVRFPDPYGAPEVLFEWRQRLWSARPAGSSAPVVFAGYARPVLTNDPRYREALGGQATRPAALLGRALDLARSTVSVNLSRAPGRNLAVLGAGTGAAQLLATAVRSIAAHHRPGEARFVLAALAAGIGPLTEALAGELSAQHVVRTVDTAGLLAELDGDEAGYLVAFGVDAPGPEELPVERLRLLLRDGPAAGRHLLGWWRTVPSFAPLLDPETGAEGLTAVAVANVPGSQLTPVLGRPVDWRPRPDRAVLWDGPNVRGTVLVPFVDGAVGGQDGPTALAGPHEVAA